ncbi:MAG: hypothetical protein QOH13_2660 [Thermoleophilaceae bacterium]|jgi:hypothetical protein|nr:hypothetical protein [Thermoleophilaceae bacterium]
MATLPNVTTRRAEAYGRVVRVLNGPDGEELTREELSKIRENADALFFCEDLDVDSSARDAADEIADMAVELVESGRWDEDTAEELVSDVLACGPVAFAG